MSEQTIGKYVIQGEIGRGAMGIVYKAIDPVIGRTVAVKIIRFDVLTSGSQREEAQKRFLREAQAAGGLSHPNIVTIYDVGETEGMSYIAMEFIEGRSLESLLAEGKLWEPADAVVFGLQVAEALDTAHRKGIVHRDIKPGNILIDAEGRPHLVDFGIARVTSSTMTQTSMVMGTPFYMAPEQIAGRKADQRADIFALGAILYEMLTLEKPFGGETLTTVIYKIMNETPPPVRTRRGGIPPALEGIVERSLVKDPEARYPNCRELIRDLQAVLYGPASAEGTADAFPAVSGTEAEKTSVFRRPVRESAAVSADLTSRAAGNRKSLLIVLALMMTVVLVVGGVLLFSPGKAVPTATGPGGGSFDVTFSSRATVGGTAVKPEPSSGENRPEPAAKPAGELSVPGGLPGSKVDPKNPSVITFEIPPPKSQEGAMGEILPPGSAEIRGKPVPEKKTDIPAPVKEKTGTIPPVTETAGKPPDPPPVKTAEKEKTPPAVLRKGETRLPRNIRRTDPVYPEQALRDRVEGDVTLEITIGSTGRVERAGVVKSIPLLDMAAIESVWNWEFEPGLLEGTPAPATLEVTIHFGLPPAATPPKSEAPAAGKGETKTVDAPKPAPPPAAESGPAAGLAKAAEAMNRGAYRDALSIAKTLLASHPNLEEAKSISLNAVIQLAPAEIKSLLDQYVLSYKIRQPGEFYQAHADAALSSRLQRDLQTMMTAYRDVQVSASNLNLDFKTARYPAYRTRAAFSQIMTGIPTAKNIREVMFEGRYVWTLERRGEEWIIVELAVE